MTVTRPYRGVSAEARRALRRRLLLDAGLEEIGTHGYDAITVRQVCRRAGLTERYFYENFADRLALLDAVYDDVIGSVLGAVTEQVGGAGANIGARIRAGVTAFIDVLAADPRLARVQLVEVVGRGPALEAKRRGVLHTFADFIAEVATGQPGSGAMDPRIAVGSLGLVGATNEVVIAWTSGTLSASRDEVIDTLTEMYAALAARLEVDRGS